MNIYKQKQGVSLIVLVITIIVMIILASAIIITLRDNGIIGTAKNAVDKTNENKIQELASLAWADAYAENVGKSEEELLPILKASVEKTLEDNKINLDEYFIKVTINEVIVRSRNNIWIQNEDHTVVKGDIVLEIGDYIDYHDTANEDGSEKYKGKWQVLGAKDGELLILSEDNILTKTLGGTTIEKCMSDYENGIDILNDLCKPYGKGENAIGARCITVEDIDRIEQIDDNYKNNFAKGQISQYGNIVTYKYNGTNKVRYESDVVNGELTYGNYDGFLWYDEKEGWKSVSYDDLLNKENDGKTICTLKSTVYGYNLYYRLEETSKVYKMLKADKEEENYWLATQFVGTYGNYVLYFITGVAESRIFCDYLVGSAFSKGERSRGVRCVVQLSIDYTPN